MWVFESGVIIAFIDIGWNSSLRYNSNNAKFLH